MTLLDAHVNSTYIIEKIDGGEKIKDFLFTLGCFEDEEITVISNLGSNIIVNIKDGRYAIDLQVAQSIFLYD